jgi:hypothetical protein
VIGPGDKLFTEKNNQLFFFPARDVNSSKPLTEEQAFIFTIYLTAITGW